MGSPRKGHCPIKVHLPYRMTNGLSEIWLLSTSILPHVWVCRKDRIIWKLNQSADSTLRVFPLASCKACLQSPAVSRGGADTDGLYHVRWLEV